MKSAFHVMAKPISNNCNIDCEYCFYIDNDESLSNSKAMDEKTLTKFITRYIKEQPSTVLDINFAWQGGEPTLLGLDYFKKVVEIQKKVAGLDYHKVSNSFQTNGILINQEWCDFFRENNFLVGISVDGDEQQHNTYRRTRSGKGTYSIVKDTISLMISNGVMVNALCVLNNVNVKQPLRTYEAIKALGIKHIQFIPLVEKHVRGAEKIIATTGSFVTEKSVGAVEYGRFLVEVFEEWREHDFREVIINDFESYLSILIHQVPLNCFSMSNCGSNLVVESDGSVYSCDHFVEHDYRLGNVNQFEFEKLVQKKQHKNFKSLNQKSSDCFSCEWLKLCQGGCPAHRDKMNKNANHLCAGYKLFFEHAIPRLESIPAEQHKFL